MEDLNLMQYEVKLAKLLDLEIVKKEYYYELQSPSGLPVGMITKSEKVVDNHQEFFFITKIEIPNFSFYRERNINEKDFNYSFYVNLDDDKRVCIDMDMGSTPILTIYTSNKEDSIKFAINDQELSLEFPTFSKKGEALEKLKIKLDNENDTERYIGNHYEYEAVTTDNYNNNKKYKLGILSVGYKKLLVGQNTPDCLRFSTVNGFVREAIKRDTNAKDLFGRFRAYVNNLLPYKKDFLETFLEERGIYDDVFAAIYPDLVKNKYYNYIMAIKDNILIGIKLSPPEETLKSYATIIYDLKDKFDFGYVNGAGDHAGFYTWNDDYVYRLSPYGDIEAIFDITNRMEIKDKDECQKLYDEFKKQKVKTLN